MGEGVEGKSQASGLQEAAPSKPLFLAPGVFPRGLPSRLAPVPAPILAPRVGRQGGLQRAGRRDPGWGCLE